MSIGEDGNIGEGIRDMSVFEESLLISIFWSDQSPHAAIGHSIDTGLNRSPTVMVGKAKNNN